MMEIINISEKLSLFSEHWNPKIVGELNGQHVKLVKLYGEFVWHKHENEDEMFFVISGILKIEFRDRTVVINPGEFSVMLFEPATTLNTGDLKGELTREKLEKI